MPWTFNDEDAIKTYTIPAAGMRHYYGWRRAIRDGNTPPNVAAGDWDANYGPGGRGYMHIRLNGMHRVFFTVDFEAEHVEVAKIGTHSPP